MPLAAHWEAPAKTGSSRKTSRRRLRLEADSQALGGQAAKVLIHNISATGLMIESTQQLEAGETIEIDLPQAGLVSARVVWADGGFFGCQFDIPITTAALSAAQLQAKASEPAQSDAEMRPTGGGEPFGQHLQRLRKEKGLTLIQLADAIGVSKPTVWAWEQERSRPTRDRHLALAQALGVQPGDLMPERNDRALREMLARFKEQIAQAVGTSPDRVKILLEL